jgi:DtxR family Mn-dependent transcriptional regulator
VDFMPKGEEYARDIIRRRRLTEVLLHNVLKLKMNTVETNACKIEHIVNEEVTDSICAFLGHPMQCPHGSPIPRGKCCRERDENIEPLLKPLSKIAPGKKTRVAFIASDEGGVLRRLTSLGVHPGAVVSVRQHQPTAILKAGETDIALEPALVERIYCRVLT